MDQESFEEISRLKQEWDSLQPLSPENEDRLWKKFRLEWNYHSNHIEGNTLTYGETELLVIFGETRGNHTIREYEEMKAHDVAIAHVRELAAESKNLTEADIRNLNKLILKEPFWKEAITAAGQPSRKEIIPGQYKTQPNNVRTATGEIFRFADPVDVPLRMREYLDLINQSFSRENLFFNNLAKLHHEFLLIHPFDDGNGRVARLLLNYALLKNEYSPIIIRTEQKEEYISALHSADVEGNYSGLEGLLLGNLKWSLEIGIKAARGSSIEEPSDIEKQIAVFAKENTAEKLVEAKTPEIILPLWENSLKPLFKGFSQKMKLFKPLFEDVKIRSSLPTNSSDNWEKDIDTALRAYPNSNSIGLEIICEGYRGKAARPFTFTFELKVFLENYQYQVAAHYLPVLSKLYSQSISSSEMEQVINEALKSMFERIKQAAERD